MRRLLLFLLLLLTTGPGRAQLPNISFEPLTDRDGLPSRSVTCAAEDTSGFVWFGTRQGLARYDGYTYRRVGEQAVYGVTVDRAGNIYAGFDADRLVRLDPNTLKTKRIVGPAEGGGWHTFIDSFGQVWFSDRESVNRYDPATNRTHRYPMTKTTYIFNKGSFAEDRQRRVWVLGMEVGLFVFDRAANRLVCKLGLDCPRPGTPAQLECWPGFIDRNDQLWMGGGSLLRYDTRTDQFRVYQAPAKAVLSVADGTDPATGKPMLWIGTDKGLGVFRPETGQFAFFDKLLPVSYSVNDIVTSRRTGIVWVCTSEGVLKYDPHNQFVKTNTLINSTNPVNAMLVDRSDPTRQTVWLAVPYRGLYRWNRTTNASTFYPFPQYADVSEATWMAQDQANTIWVGCNQWQSTADGKGDKSDNRFEGLFRFDPVAGRYQPTPVSIHHTFFSVPFYSLGLFDRRGRFWIANHYESLHVIDPKTNVEIKLWSPEAHAELFKDGAWLMRVFEDSRGRIWLGTTHGLFWFDEPTGTFHKLKTDNSLLDIAEARDGNLWVVGWQMMLKVSPLGKILHVWKPGNGLYDVECRRVTVDAQNRVWIGTFDGLHRLDPATNTFRRFTINDGLLTSNTMMSLCVADANTLLVGNTGGWNTLDLPTLDRSATVSNLRLTEVRVNNQPRPADWSKPVTLEANETAISFDFSAMNFRKPVDNQYQYRLEGQDKTWVSAGTGHQAIYTNLDPKNYVFHVRLVGSGAGAGRELQVPFRVSPAFYETVWFAALLVLVVAGSLTFFYRNRLNYQTIKARLELEEATRQQREAKYNEDIATYQLRVSETEMTALRAQMNPHFIFNCLNSIQYFTAQNNSDKASEYLNKFSRLIRLVLENSRSERVTLANELETLRLYIEMEAMRFPQKLHYHIHIADDLDTDSIQIPPLLLQPFVENAIWHGLMHKDEGGTVDVVVHQSGEHLLHIDITDDGVGRAKAAEYKSKSATRHKSFGMKMTAERIDLINQLFHTQTQVEIVDLVDPEGHPAGTKVVVEIPV